MWLLFFLINSFADEDPPKSVRGWYAYHWTRPATTPCRLVDAKLSKQILKLSCRRDIEREEQRVVCREPPKYDNAWFVYPTLKSCLDENPSN